MARAHRDLVAKAIAELTHERLLEPVGDGDQWRLDLDGSTYEFTARRHPLEHWVVDAASIRRTVAGEPVPVDAQDFVVDCHDRLGIPDHLLPVYLEEIASTLASAAWKLTHHQLSSADLVHADYQAIEAAMTEGHPGFVACNGRIGWGVDDYAAYAPEAGADVHLHWLAVLRGEAHLSLSADRTEERALPRRARRGRARGLREAAARPRPRPGRLPLPPRAPLAVDQPPRRHLRARRRTPGARPPG